jgi:hypothetical protein
MIGMSAAVRFALGALVALGTVACHKGPPRTPLQSPPPPPPLAIPEPPPRLTIPVSVVVEPPPEATPPPSANAPARQPRPNPATPPPQPPTPPAQTQNTEPPPVVQTTQNADQLEQQTRRQMESARTHLTQVKYDALSPSGRATYDEVLRFIRQAEEKLRIRNYVLAEELAKKAIQLASQLVKRDPSTADAGN